MDSSKPDKFFDRAAAARAALELRSAGAGKGLMSHLRAASCFLDLRAAFDRHPDMQEVYSFCYGRDDFRFLFEVSRSQGVGECCFAVENYFDSIDHLKAVGTAPATRYELNAARIVAERHHHDAASFKAATRAALADLDLFEVGLVLACPKLGQEFRNGLDARAERGMDASQMAKAFHCPAAAAILEAVEIEAAAAPGAKAARAPSL